MNFVAIITKREKCSSWEEFGNRDASFISSMWSCPSHGGGIHTDKGGMDSQISSKYIFSLKKFLHLPKQALKQNWIHISYTEMLQCQTVVGERKFHFSWEVTGHWMSEGLPTVVTLHDLLHILKNNAKIWAIFVLFFPRGKIWWI